MIRGSHNTLSYLPVRRWWMRPLAVFARCQERTLEEQIGRGCRYFDLRVREVDDGLWVPAHGLVEYDGSVWAALDRIRCLSLETGRECYVRVMLEAVRDATAKERASFDGLMALLSSQYGDGRSMRLRFMVKNPYVMVRDGFGAVEFREVAEWIDRWWKLVVTPRFFRERQRSRKAALEEEGYAGICAEDFV